MTSGGDPWHDISVPLRSAGRIERRADPQHPVDFYRARLPGGRYLFLLKNVVEIQTRQIPVLAGLEVRLEPQPNNTSELIFELTDDVQVSLFRVLTQDFLDATADLVSGSSDLAAHRTMVRLEKWQSMLRRLRDNVLSRQSIIGLTGELLFLRDRLLPHLGVEQTLRAWRGPQQDEQDFAHGDYIFEVKTQLSTADQYLLISSEAQLDDSSGRIVVYYQTLVSCHDDENGESLNQLVEDLRKTCRAHSILAQDLLDAGLIAAGYLTRPDYDGERWKPVQTRIFEVIDDFPRLTPASLPPGVSNVKYRIAVGTFDRFERTSDWLNGKFLG